jgi:hypothetical protein
MTVTVKHIDVVTAFKFGLVFGPILYTVNGFVFTLGGFGVSLPAYLGGVVTAVIYGAVGAAITAFVYNVVSRRFGSIRLVLEVVNESQDHT